MTASDDSTVDLRDTLNYLLEASAASLNKNIGDDDRSLISQARADIHIDSQLLRAILGPLKTADHSDWRLLCLNRLIEAAITIASRCIITEPVDRHVKRHQAGKARDARRNKKIDTPKERAITAAITSSTNGWDGKHPSKMAESIAAHLGASGVKISSRAIANRLKKEVHQELPRIIA